MACRMRMTVGCVEQDDWSCHGPRAGLCGWRSRASEGERGAVETVAEACRDLERAGGRLALTGRLAALLARTPAELLPTVCYLCQGLIAPEFAGVGLGLAEKLAVRAVSTATGAGPEQVAASVRETGDLGLAAEQMLTVTAAGRAASLEATVVVETLHRIAGSGGPGSQGRKLELLAGMLGQATPLEARYLLRLVTGGLRLGIGTPTILDALAQVHAVASGTNRCQFLYFSATGVQGLVTTSPGGIRGPPRPLRRRRDLSPASSRRGRGESPAARAAARGPGWVRRRRSLLRRARAGRGGGRWRGSIP